MPADVAAVPLRRLSTSRPAHNILRLLRRYSVCAITCALAAALLLAMQAYVTPYPLPASLQLLAPIFLLVAVAIRFGVTRYRWYDLREDGLHYKSAFGRMHWIPWADMRELRYVAGIAVPFGVQVAGRRSPIQLGVPHSDLQEWTDQCLDHMQLDLTAGGPLRTFRRPEVFWSASVTLAIAIALTPLGIVRSLNGASDLAGLLLIAITLAGACVTLLHQPLSWSAAGVRIGRPTAPWTPWADVRAEWKRTRLGGSALCLRVGRRPPIRVGLSAWGAPRFVARLTDGGHVADPFIGGLTPRTGLLFPAMLAVVTIIAGLQFREGARILSNMSAQQLWAVTGPATTAEITGTRTSDRGLEVRYRYDARGRRYHGRAWLLRTARGTVEPGSLLPATFAPGAPDASLLHGDPRIFYAGYYMIFGLFHVLLVIPLLALWDIVPAPAPYTIPALGT